MKGQRCNSAELLGYFKSSPSRLLLLFHITSLNCKQCLFCSLREQGPCKVIVRTYTCCRSAVQGKVILLLKKKGRSDITLHIYSFCPPVITQKWGKKKISKSHFLLDITDGLIMHVRVIVAILPVAQVSSDNLIVLYVDLVIIHNLGVIITI